MFKNSFYYTFEKLSPKIISVLLLPVLLRLIKPELWAEITLLLGIQLLFSYFLTQGDEKSILKFTSNNEELQKSFMSLIRYSLVGFVVIEIVGQIMTNLPFSIIYGLPFRFMFFSTVLISVNKLFLAKLRSLEKSTVVFKSSFVEAIFINSFQLISIAVTVQLDGYDSRVIVSAYFAVQFLGNLIKFLYYIKQIDFDLIKSPSYFLSKKPDQFLKFSNVSFLILLSNSFLNWQDKFFVEIIFGLKELGIYSLATRISNLGMVFISSLLVAAYSKYWPSDLSNSVDNQVFKVIKDILSISCFSLCSLMLLVTSVGEYIFPKSYLFSINLIYLAVLLVFLQAIVLIFSIDFGRQNKLKKVFFFNLLAFTTQIIGYLYLDLINLSQIFYLQIITISFFLFIFFYKSFSLYFFKFIQIFLIFSISIFITNSYLNNSVQFLQIVLFLFGLFLVGLTIQTWINLDNKSSF